MDMIRIHRPAEKHAVPEHRDYRIERVRHELLKVGYLPYIRALIYEATDVDGQPTTVRCV